ncbi:MAG: hypothetical protein M0Q48_04645 [Verrucomicrobia bacterium]|nr:hypothetical protein [Verrucomicrobiota bacterium]
MKKYIHWFFALSLSLCFFFEFEVRADKIDRKSVVARHKVVIHATIPNSPAQVGNGSFAFGVDITGLQTFFPFNTMADWSWHSFPMPDGSKLEDYKPTIIETCGRQVPYLYPDPEHPELSSWMAANPHRFNLGRIGFRLLKEDGTEAKLEDMQDARQELDLWTGIIQSEFLLQGVPVTVLTACHPDRDLLGVRVESDLIRQGRLSIFLDFPYPNQAQFADYVGTYDQPQSHSSSVGLQTDRCLQIFRRMDRVNYVSTLHWESKADILMPQTNGSHRFYLLPGVEQEIFEFTCFFSQLDKNIDSVVSPSALFEQSRRAWAAFWNSGAAVDFSECTDSRWKELERRVVLSQYLLRVNEAGKLPPQESGLVNNGWFGRHHFEMVWWHGVHYGQWNRWSFFDRYLKVYRQFLPTSQARALSQGYKGARWPKCTADIDRDWPHPIHATLIWQQPHPIYFAEMDYRLHPNQKTLDKWKDIVFSTADFMADYACYQPEKDRFVLGPPLYIVSENTDNRTTLNPAFELGYWRYGLRVASEWRKRLSLPPEARWIQVMEKLAPLPVQECLYVTHEDIQQMWTKYNFEHPALTGVLGMLPGDGVDREIFTHTLERVCETWNFNRTWGWDFPMLAMAAARSGNSELAVDMLLHPAPGFQFDPHGLATGGPFPYFPSNGGLLAAIGMMCGGWDGSEGDNPGFPKNELWKVKSEGFAPLQ